MKLKLAFFTCALAMASNSHAAVYYVTNVGTGYAYSDGLFQNADNSLLDGGIVAMGVFGGTGFDEFDIATSISNFTILASGLAGSPSATLVGSFAGYVEANVQGPVVNETTNSSLLGQSLFIFVGNAATLAASTTYGLFSVGTIQSDDPNEQTYLANPFNSLSPNTLLLGEVGTFDGDITTDLGTETSTFSTLKLAAAPVPEPSAVILGGLGVLAACFRRRRN